MEEPCSQKGRNRTSTCARSRATSFATIRAARPREAGARPRRLRAGWEPLIESRAQRACGSDRRCRSSARASPLARCSTGTDCECRRAYAAGLERRAARGSEASSQNCCRPSQPRHAHHSMCNARVLGKTEASLPPTHLPSHATCAVACYALPHEPPRTPEATRREIRLPVADCRANRRPTLIRLPSELQLRDHVLMSPLVSLDPSLT